jgi:hypothetical protein
MICCRDTAEILLQQHYAPNFRATMAATLTKHNISADQIKQSPACLMKRRLPKFK